MSIWSLLRRGLGVTGEASPLGPTSQVLPTFERLEPRLLLSGDPIGLGTLESLDHRSDSEVAIVIDFELPAEAEDLSPSNGHAEDLNWAGDDLESGPVLTDDSDAVLEQSEVKTSGGQGQVQTNSAIDFSAENTKTRTEADASVSYDNESESNYTDELSQTLLAANPPPMAEVNYSSDILATLY